ncbi:MAG TPA: Maf family protein [bacterium]|nr:Maf family protein [bacterium]
MSRPSEAAKAHCPTGTAEVNIYLASTSPRRRDLLRRLGLRFRILTPTASESPDAVGVKPGDSPGRYAVACAKAKALSVVDRVNDGLVVGVDTVVVCGKLILGKPRSTAEARKMLRLLSGRTHSVISGVAIARVLPSSGECDRGRHRIVAAAETTQVTFRKLGSDEIERYIAGPEPYDKAGAYGIQDEAGVFVSRVSGCLMNVVGLPIPLLLRLLEQSRAGRVHQPRTN